MPVTWWRLSPLDTIVVRDGRPFDAGDTATAHAILPTPFTTTGAVCDALGVRELEWAVGPGIVDGADQLLFPVPADVIADDRNVVVRCAPQNAPGVTTDFDELCILDGIGEAPAGLVDARTLTDYLAGDVSRFTVVADPMIVEPHIGLYRPDGRQAADGYLYSTGHLRPTGGAGFAVRARVDATGTVRSPVRLGGEGRTVEFAPFSRPPTVPDPPERFPGGRVAVYLATPAIFADGWRPPDPPGGHLVAAAVTGPVPIASRGKTPTGEHGHRIRWAAPAGSVYLFEFADESTGATWARRQHDRCLIQGHGRFRTAGFGWAFTGTW